MTTETFTWIDPDGIATPLRVGFNATMGDVMGRFMPPVLHQEDAIPLQPGGRHRLSVHLQHDFILPINVLGTSFVDTRTQLRALVSAMNPLRGSGVMRINTVVGDTREIECFYVTGLEMDENITKYGKFGQQVYVTFRAYDPYWRDTSDTAMVWQVSSIPNFFPFFPMRLSAGAIAVQSSVVNAGDVKTWPVWTIVGPGGGLGGITLQNVTTGETLAFNTTLLGSGESITIDTRPGAKTVLKQDGTNLFPDLKSNSVLWGLQPGTNAINLQFTNAIPGQTVLSLNYRNKYLSP